MIKRSKIEINNFLEGVNEWIEDLPYLGKRPSTLKAYENAVNNFTGYLKDNHVETVSQLSLLDYKSSLEDQKETNSRKRKLKHGDITSSNTINLRLTVVNRLFKDLGYSDIKVDLIKDTTGATKDTVPTDEEYFKMLESAERLKKRKMALLLETLILTGARISEIEDLRLESTKPKKRYFTTTNKGKTRDIFIPKGLNRKLRRYCKDNGITEDDCIIFSSRDGKKMLDQSYIRDEFKVIAKDAGVNLKKAHPHALRHKFSKFYSLIPDTNPYLLSTIMGHSRTVTEDYINSDTSRDAFKDSVDKVESYYLELQKEFKKKNRLKRTSRKRGKK